MLDHPTNNLAQRGRRYLDWAAAVLVLGGLAAHHYWGVPAVQQLPSWYGKQTHFELDDSFRTSLGAPWERSRLHGRRVDLTLVAGAGVSIVQADLRWVNDSGYRVFHNNGIYGVDRRTRANLPAYGDVSRTGQFLTPPGTSERGFDLWDPMFLGPRRAEFVGRERREGLVLMRFHFRASGVDETEGYANMPDVPERYQARTDGSGVLWIEPDSGIMVDCRETGTSYFVDPVSGRRIGDFHHWSGSFTDASRRERLATARLVRARMLRLQYGPPAALLGCALVYVAWRRRRSAPVREQGA